MRDYAGAISDDSVIDLGGVLVLVCVRLSSRK